MLHSVALDDLRVLAVTGSDRATFLQGQLTQDVASARPDHTLMAGWADAKGRLLFAGHFFSTRTGGDDALALLVPAALADGLSQRMKMFVFRARVRIAVLDLPVTGFIGTGVPEGAGQVLRILGRHERQFVLGSVPPATSVPRSEWQLADVRAGLPEISAATSGEFVPQMVNLDLLGGISFTKGCYTGQEIVARMKYLGRVKRRMLRFSAPGAPPAAGDPLHGERGTVGQVVNSAPTAAGTEFLAVVVLDDLPGPFHLDDSQTRPARRLDLPYEVPT